MNIRSMHDSHLFNSRKVSGGSVQLDEGGKRTSCDSILTRVAVDLDSSIYLRSILGIYPLVTIPSIPQVAFVSQTSSTLPARSATYTVFYHLSIFVHEHLRLWSRRAILPSSVRSIRRRRGGNTSSFPTAAAGRRSTRT